MKTAGKTAEEGPWGVTVKQPKNSRKNTRNTPKNSENSCFSGVSGVFPAVFRLFYRDPPGTLFGCFSGCFQCRAFGTSVAGRRDCNVFPSTLSWFPNVLVETLSGLPSVPFGTFPGLPKVPPSGLRRLEAWKYLQAARLQNETAPENFFNLTRKTV